MTDRLTRNCLSPCSDRTRAPKLLELKHDVRREDRESETAPHYSLDSRSTQILPACYAQYHSHFKKHQSDSEAAGHPLAVLLDFAFENERKSDGGGEYQQGRIDHSSDAERARFSHSFLEVLYVSPEWGNDKHGSDVDSTRDPMQLGETLAKSI